MTGFTHDHSFPIPASPERLFRALTDERELTAWFAEKARVEPRVGGSYAFWGRHTVGTPTEEEADGEITELERDARLAYEWGVLGVPSTVSITLTPEETEMGPATRVAIRHTLEQDLDRPRPKELIDDWWRFTLGNLMAHATEHGEVLRPDFADPEPEIRLSMRVDAPPSDVFRALTDPEALEQWMDAQDPVVEPWVGGRYSLGWKYTCEGREVEGGPMEVLDIVPDERLVVSWGDWRGDPSVPTQSIEWRLEAEGEGTRVTLVHSGFTRVVDFSDYPFGWGHFMSQMAQVAERYAAA